MLTSEKFAQEAQSLVNRGITYEEMDCQELVEHCLRQVGIKADWKGSNHMFRDMAWVGTPEECRDRYGCIPVGAWLFIWADDGGEISRGYRDGLGNASHVGVYTGQGKGAVHSSSSRGCVCESAFSGKTIRNGGWNRVGLCRLLDYGLTVEDDSPVVNLCPTCGQEIRAAYTRLLRRGSEGDDVAAVQRALIALGYDLGTYGADGEYGIYTVAAVRQFQRSRCLEVDGVVGPDTWTQLMS